MIAFTASCYVCGKKVLECFIDTAVATLGDFIEKVGLARWGVLSLGHSSHDCGPLCPDLPLHQVLKTKLGFNSPDVAIGSQGTCALVVTA